MLFDTVRIQKSYYLACVTDGNAAFDFIMADRSGVMFNSIDEMVDQRPIAEYIMSLYPEIASHLAARDEIANPLGRGVFAGICTLEGSGSKVSGLR